MKSVMIGLHRIMSIIIIALIATLIFVGCNSRVSLLPEDTPDLKTPPSVEPLEPTKEPEYTPGPTGEPSQTPSSTQEPMITPTPESTPTIKPADTPTPKPTIEPTIKPKDTPTPLAPLDVTIEFLRQVEDEIVVLCNVERAKEGLKPLVSNTSLNKIARYKSEEMSLYNYFKHTSPVTGYEPWDLASKKFGYKYKTFGENIWMMSGTNYSQGDLNIFITNITAEQIVDSWMNSKGHRENILNGKFGKIGVGVAVCSDFRAYATQSFSD